MCPVKVLCLLILLQTFSPPAEAIRCFQCQDYLSPTLCADITTCAADEYCYVEEYITTSGHVVYDSGCRSKDWCSSSVRYFGALNKRQMDMRINDVLVCSECCHGDFCNNEGCNKRVIDRDQRGPYCFDCDFMSSPDGCDSVTMCAKDQQCILYVPKEFHYYPTLLYSAGCQTNETCKVLTYDNGHGVCPPTCCTDDFCNTACGTSHTPTTTSSTTTITTPTLSGNTTTTTITTTTTSTISTTTPSPTTVTYPCGSNGYEEIPHSHGVCIKIVNYEVTWSQARMICRGDYADLLVLDTNVKIHQVTEYLKHHHVHHDKFWIGLYDQFNNNTFIWVDGQPLSNTASNWVDDKHDPEHAGHREDCVRMEKPDHFEWKNVICDDLHHTFFICERK